MATTTVYIDDRDSSISYSRPASGGHWSNQSSRTSDAFQSTLKLTRTRNASATVSFRGTSITVVGVVEDGGSSNIAPSSSYQIDGGSVRVYNGVLAGSDQYHTQFFKSDPLPMGQHTLVIKNLAEGSFFWLDAFIITQGPEPVNNPPTPTPNSAPTRTTAIAAVPIQTVTVTTPGVAQSTTSTTTPPNSSPNSSLDSSPGSSVVIQDSSGSKTTIVFTETILTTHQTLSSSNFGAGAGTSGSNVAGDVFMGSSRQQAPVPLGAIIGGVLGGLAIILGILLVFLWRVRRSRRIKASSSRGEASSEWGAQFQRSQQVSPFQSSIATGPPMSQFKREASSPSDENEDSSMAARVNTWKETLGGNVNVPAIGKRQLAAMNGNTVPDSDTDDFLPSYLPNGRLRSGEHVLDARFARLSLKS